MNNTNIDLRDYYPILNECNKYLRSLQKTKREPSDATKMQYVKDVNRMYKNNDDPLTLCTTKNTYYKYRAAWSYVNIELAKQLIDEISNESNNEEKVILIKLLNEITEKIKRFPPDYNGSNLKLSENGKYESDWKKVKDKAPSSKSKKYQKLTKNQRENYFNHVLDKKSIYTDSIALMSICGCRPAEIESGILIRLQDDGSIKISIESKKTHGGQYGQQLREFKIKSESIEFNYLVDRMKNNNNELLIQIKSAKNLGTQMEKFSKKVFHRMKIPITPYTYRHQFGKAIKSTLSDKKDIAIALGHSNDKSQRYYANGGKDAGGFKIDLITGTRDVKEISKTNTFDKTMLDENKNKQK